jgi:hypothetical protein
MSALASANRELAGRIPPRSGFLAVHWEHSSKQRGLEMENPRSRLVVLGVVVLVVAAACGPLAAQEVEVDQPEIPAGMTAEEMAAWEAAITPGPEHEVLAEMAGSWTFKGTFWMAPGAPPMEASGTAERKMILDGRVLVEKVHSEWMGEAFEGIAMTGYDNVAGSYWGTWVDNMSTGVMLSTGSCSDGSCEFEGTYSDPLSGGSKTSRTTMTAQAEREVHETFEPGPDGEFRSARMVYTRVE